MNVKILVRDRGIILFLNFHYLFSKENLFFFPTDAAEHFVLIISGDTDQKAASCSQVQHFCQVLKDFLVPHVAIVPTMECPVFWLTDKQKKELILPNQTRAAFLKNCYKKVSITAYIWRNMV